MTEEMKSQIIKISETGLTNMFDRNMVREIADCMGYYELAEWLEDKSHGGEYVHFIMTGE